jgi:hypothetical protein
LISLIVTTYHIFWFFTLDQALDVFDDNYNYIWDFSVYCGNDLERIPRYFGKNEWNKMMDAWVYFCFKIDGFEIFLTETKGLGKI